jgi:hypothetical protein
LQDEFLKLVTDRQNGRLDAETLLRQAEELLAGLPLYPPQAVMSIGIAAADCLDAAPGMAVDVVLKLVSSTEREVRAVTAAIVFRFARYQPGYWIDTVQLLIGDEDWEVRDLASHIFDTQEFGEGAVDFHLEFVLDTVQKWVADANALTRRAATQALLGHASRHAEFRPKLLEILHPLLDDPSEYVRDNHTAALRKLGRADPALVMDYIERSLPSAGDLARDTFRTVLNQPWAAKLPERKLQLLAALNLPVT